jgi:DNA polymerase zeta
LKIVVIDPAFVTRAVTVLQFGNVMRTRFNVYESHLSFVLQFMCDFGLYGCGWIDLGEVWQRGQEDEERERELDHNDHNGTFLKFKLSPHFRQTRMPLEVDAAAHQILNRHQLVARDLHHKLTIPAPPLPSEPLVISVRELWEDERRRRLARGLSPSPEIPVDLSESSRGAGGEWVAEARWWDEVRKRIEKEGEGDVEAVANENGWEKEVMSTFESVQALWERERKRRQHRSRDPSEARVGQVQTGQLDDGGHEGGEESETQDEYVDGLWDQPNIGAHGVEVDVDEIMLSSQEMSRMVEIEIQEWAKLADENKAFENEDGDEDESYFDDEEDVLLSEDGPPDLQADIDSISRSHTSDRTKLKKFAVMML